MERAVTLPRLDRDRLRWPAAISLAAAAIGAFLVWHAEAGRITANRAHTAALAERDEQRVQVEQAASGEYQRQLRILSAMQARGLIGEEPRADWIRVLQEIAGERLVTDLRHELTPPQPISTDATSSLHYQYSRMRLQMQIMHEGDLLHVLGLLQQRARAIVHVRACDLARLDDWIDGGGTTANLDVICQLDWITLRQAGDSR